MFAGIPSFYNGTYTLLRYVTVYFRYTLLHILLLFLFFFGIFRFCIITVFYYIFTAFLFPF